MYSRFGLVLMVTHDCNMRCSYCYTGSKSDRPMPEEVGRRAVDRALASIERGGTLELGFFGGEPMLEAPLVLRLLDYARRRSAERGLTVAAQVTTNGTVRTPAAWEVMTDAGVDLVLSMDGTIAIHDRHRRFAGGKASSARVIGTIRRLQHTGTRPRAASVVRPDTASHLGESLAFLRTLGIRQVDLCLDLWTRWEPADAESLRRGIERAADVWRDSVPGFSVNWFDEKAAYLLGARTGPTARCSFGDGEVAVAPSGRLYPCERLIGDDGPSGGTALAGDVFDADDFLRRGGRAGCAGPPAARSSPECVLCTISDGCSATCRCSNYVRTGNPSTPDRLLCELNRACMRETARALRELAPRAAPVRS